MHTAQTLTFHTLNTSAVTISLFPTSIDLNRFLKKDRDLDRFRFSYTAGRSVGRSVLLNT